MNKEKKEILIASSDIYSPNSNILYQKDFEWDIQGNNLFDEKSSTWLKVVTPIFIKEYKINRWGDLLLIFSNGEYLEIFIDSSDDAECWRLLKYNNPEEHLVVSRLGVDYE